MSKRKDKREYKYYEEEEQMSIDLSNAIINLYLSLKIRNHNESESLTEDQMEEERQSLQKLSSFVVLEYIRNSFDILMSLKL